MTSFDDFREECPKRDVLQCTMVEMIPQRTLSGNLNSPGVPLCTVQDNCGLYYVYQCLSRDMNAFQEQFRGDGK